jgi:hypothetical protein
VKGGGGQEACPGSGLGHQVTTGTEGAVSANTYIKTKKRKKIHILS